MNFLIPMMIDLKHNLIEVTSKGVSNIAIFSFFFCFGILLIPHTITAQQPQGSSSINGTIKLPSTHSGIKKGNGYENNPDIMHSDDPMANPERNIIVSLHPLDFQAKATPLQDAYITQKEQTFLPHVLPVTIGTKVYFLNEDQFFHNVYSATPKSRFNIGRRPPGNAYGQVIKKTGVITLSCDIHSHMKGYVICLDTPYFTRADKDGNYNLNNLPSGRYRLECFFPDGKSQSLTVELIENTSITQNIDLTK